MLTQKINTRKDISKHTVSAEILKRYFFFFFIYFHHVEANYFTTLQWFLSYIDMNQPWIYSIPHPGPPHPASLST